MRALLGPLTVLRYTMCTYYEICYNHIFKILVRIDFYSKKFLLKTVCSTHTLCSEKKTTYTASVRIEIIDSFD